MDRFKDVQVGDKLYHRVYGNLTVFAVREKFFSANFSSNPNNDHFLFWLSGKQYLEESEVCLFYIDGDNKYAEKRPISTINTNLIPIDHPVTIGDLGLKRHFAYASSTQRFVFIDGKTSFSGNYKANLIPSHEPLYLGKELTVGVITYPVGTKVVI